MKIICTGNPDKDFTIAHSIKKYFPDTTFVHRSNGFDLTTNDGKLLFEQLLKEHNVFINSSYIDHGIQEQLLCIARNTWNAGHVFNIGSTIEYQTFKTNDTLYLESKLNLRNKSIELCRLDFKTTHIIISGFKNNDPIAKTIQWILYTTDADIPIIGVNDNQLSKEFLELWNNK